MKTPKKLLNWSLGLNFMAGLIYFHVGLISLFTLRTFNSDFYNLAIMIINILSLFSYWFVFFSAKPFANHFTLLLISIPILTYAHLAITSIPFELYSIRDVLGILYILVPLIVTFFNVLCFFTIRKNKVSCND